MSCSNLKKYPIASLTKSTMESKSLLHQVALPIEDDAQEINSSNFIVPWSGKLKKCIEEPSTTKNMLLNLSIGEPEGCEFQECMLEPWG